jgi:hypothetical protein
VLISAVIGASGCFGGDGGGASSARTHAAGERFGVTSTLARFKVAPGHVHWIADPQTPYTYGGDGGYLVTTWMARVEGEGGDAPRFTRHTFTTEAVAVDGSRAREVDVLRVRR